jgi:hypothetical protein
VLLVGNFNVDGLLMSKKKGDLNALGMLNLPKNYTQIDKRRAEVSGEYNHTLKLFAN